MRKNGLNITVLTICILFLLPGYGFALADNFAGLQSYIASDGAVYVIEDKAYSYSFGTTSGNALLFEPVRLKNGEYAPPDPYFDLTRVIKDGEDVLLNLIANAITPAEFERLKNTDERLGISVYVNTTTGKVLTVRFSFSKGTQIAEIYTPQKLHELSLAIKSEVIYLASDRTKELYYFIGCWQPLAFKDFNIQMTSNK